MGTAGLLDSVAGRTDCDGGHGPCGVIGHAEFAVGGEAWKGGVLEIPAGQSPELVKFLLGRGLGRDSFLL